MNLCIQLEKILNSWQTCLKDMPPSMSYLLSVLRTVRAQNWTWCSCSSGTSITNPCWGGMTGITEDGSMLTSPEPPRLTSGASGMLSHQNISPVHPYLWEHYNSDKTCLSYFLPPSWNQPSPFPGRLVIQLGGPESQISKAWQLGTSGYTSYIPWGMQLEISLSRSHISEGIPGAW